jgi:selenocysteine lyase/cysteine desulfurase
VPCTLSHTAANNPATPGVGALLARRKSAAALRITYFGGGSVVDATAEDVWRVLMPLPEGLEAGTPPFLDILQLKHGFDMLRRLGGMPAIEAHVESLRAWTAPRLAALRHPGGAPLLRLFGAHGRGPRVQSGVFAFLVLHANGSSRAAPWVQQDAAAAGLHVRSGCVCNPGQCHYDVGLRPEEVRQGGGARERTRAEWCTQGEGQRLLSRWAHGVRGWAVLLCAPRLARAGCMCRAMGTGIARPQADASPEVLNSHLPAPTRMQARARALDGARAGTDDLAPLVTVARPGADGRPARVRLAAGVVRASLGPLSTFEDVCALLEFLRGYRELVL